MAYAGILKTSGLLVGITADEVANLAKASIGQTWTDDGCAAFTWGISNLAGVPFFDSRDMTVGSDPTKISDPALGYVVPHSWNTNVGGDGWSVVSTQTSVSTLRNTLKKGDIVRLYAEGNTSETSGPTPGYTFSAHSFVVVSNEGGNIEVVDNWSGGKISQHSFARIANHFAPEGSFQSVIVSRIDSEWVNANVPNTLQGFGKGDWSAIGSTPTTYSLTPTSPTITEGDSGSKTITFTVTRSGGTPSETITYSTLVGSASSGKGDYKGEVDTSLYFASGQTSKTFSISIYGDTENEGDETFGVIIEKNGSELDRSTVTITDDDAVAPTTYSLTPVSPNVTELNNGATNLAFTVTRSGGLPAETITYSTIFGTASAGDGDYKGEVDTNLTFYAGQTSKQFTITIYGDTEIEGDETFDVVIEKASTELDRATVTVVDDDPASGPVYELLPVSTRIDEGDSGTKTITFSAHRSGAYPAETIYYSTLVGSASAGDGDYVGVVDNPLLFSVGDSWKKFTITVNGDTKFEGDETFSVIIESGAGSELDRSTITITDDDTATVTPRVSISNVEPNSVVEGGSLTFRVTLIDGAIGSNLNVSYSDVGTAEGGLDYTIPAGNVIILAGNTFADIVVDTIDDNVVGEGSEGLSLVLNDTADYDVGLVSAGGTITDNDGALFSNGNDVVDLPSPGTYHALQGDDSIVGTRGRDRVFGDAGDDYIIGKKGRDRLAGGDGQDTIRGGKAKDFLYGNTGNDILYGNFGDDVIKGGRGRDRISGGDDDDILYGGKGRDRFFTNTFDGNDIIRDFEDDIDTLFFAKTIWGGGLTKNEFLETYASVDSGDVVFNFGGGNILTVENVNDRSLLVDDLVFF